MRTKKKTATPTLDWFFSLNIFVRKYWKSCLIKFCFPYLIKQDFSCTCVALLLVRDRTWGLQMERPLEDIYTRFVEKVKRLMILCRFGRVGLWDPTDIKLSRKCTNGLFSNWWLAGTDDIRHSRNWTLPLMREWDNISTQIVLKYFDLRTKNRGEISY